MYTHYLKSNNKCTSSLEEHTVKYMKPWKNRIDFATVDEEEAEAKIRLFVTNSAKEMIL